MLPQAADTDALKTLASVLNWAIWLVFLAPYPFFRGNS